MTVEQTTNDCEEADLPDEFCCPITNTIMNDPVVSKFGHSYERSAIIEWLGSHSHTCPMTRNKLNLSDLITNHKLRVDIRRWQIAHQEEVTVFAADIDDMWVVGYFDMPDKGFDETEGTDESDDSDSVGEDATDSERERRRNRYNGSTSTSSSRNFRTRQHTHRQDLRHQNHQSPSISALIFLEQHRRRILARLRPQAEQEQS
jgi:hypothetical protein